MKHRITFKILSDYRTFLMGIAIISIMIFHFTEDCYIYQYMYKGPIKIYYEYICAVGVDIFLMLSGLGLFYSMKKNNKTKEFYKKRYIRILIPYLLVAIPALIQFCIVNNEGVVYFFKELTFINVLQLGTKKYWFILFICICYFIFPVLFNYINNSKNVDEVVTKTLLLAVIVTLFNEMFRTGNPVLYSRTSLMTLRFFSFFVGILFGYLSYNKEKIKTSHIVSMVLCLFVIVLANSQNETIRTISRFLSATSFCILLVLLLSKIDKNKVINFFKKIIEWFGKYSLELYLLHVSIRRVFGTLHLEPCKVKYFIIYIVISIILVPIVNKLCKIIEKPVTNLLNIKKNKRSNA